MAFEELSLAPPAKNMSAAIAHSDQVMAYVNMMRGSPVIRVKIGHKLISRLGWQPTETVSVAVGTGTDAGKLRLRPAVTGRALQSRPTGTKKSTMSEGLSQLIFPARNARNEPLVEDAKKPSLVDREVLSVSGGKGDLFLTLPRAWFSPAR